MTKRFLIVVILSFVMLGMIVASARSADVPRITKEKLKEMMGSPDLILIDVRSTDDWKESDLKITGAVREDPYDLKSWSHKYPMEKTLVLY